MIRDDWLLRQIHDLGRAIARIAGAEQPHVELEQAVVDLCGLSLAVISVLPPDQAVAMVAHRSGELEPGSAFAALRLLQRAADEGHDVGGHVQAFRRALLAKVGEDGLRAFEQALAGIQDA